MINNFSIKEGLLKLKEKNYDSNINKTIDLLVENYDENQIRIISQYQGIKIDNNLIRLYFYDNVGFRCMNEKSEIYGKFPICNNIEKYMNKLYVDSITDFYEL